jgi:hypothetical protein
MKRFFEHIRQTPVFNVHFGQSVVTTVSSENFLNCDDVWRISTSSFRTGSSMTLHNPGYDSERMNIIFLTRRLGLPDDPVGLSQRWEFESNIAYEFKRLVVSHHPHGTIHRNFKKITRILNSIGQDWDYLAVEQFASKTLVGTMCMYTNFMLVNKHLGLFWFQEKGFPCFEFEFTLDQMTEPIQEIGTFDDISRYQIKLSYGSKPQDDIMVVDDLGIIELKMNSKMLSKFNTQHQNEFANWLESKSLALDDCQEII